MRRPDPFSRSRGLVVAATALLLADAAHAQANACEQLKETLAARIDPSIKGFSLDIVPAAMPVPPGAKVIGTCEGGARKVLFARGGGSRPLADTPAAATPAAVAAPVPAPAPRPAPPPPPPPAQVEAAALPPSPPRAPAPAPRAPEPAASAAAEPVRVAEVGTAAPPAPAVEAAPAPAPAAAPPPAFGSRYWHWVAAVAVLLGAATLRSWWVRRTAYDEAGLPRGPKLN